MRKNILSEGLNTQHTLQRSKKSSSYLTLLVISMILTIMLNNCGFPSYPDAINTSRHKNYGFTRIYRVKQERNNFSGVNLCETWQHFNLNETGVRFDEYDLDAMRDAGFRYIRVPTNFLSYLRKSGDTYQIAPELFPRLDWIIQNILVRDMIAILDFQYLIPDEKHAFDSDQERRENEAQFLAVWKILAKRYKDYPPGLYFELANEPHKPITPDIWNRYVKQALELIRSSGGNNPERMIVVATNILIPWDEVNGIHQLELPSIEEDPNIMVTFHHYKPTTFTFQGQDFIEAYHSHDWLGNMWDNTEQQKALVRKDFEVISKWAEKNKHQIILGEFGVSKKADIVSQVNWTQFIREEAESRGMIWLYWQILDDNDRVGGLYDPSIGSWQKELLNALFPENRWMVNKGGNDAPSEEWKEEREHKVREVIAALQDPEWTIRKHAAIALRTTEPEADLAIPALITTLKDTEWQVRKEAARALTGRGSASRPAVSALFEILHDEEWQVRMAAAQTLTVIGPAAQPAVQTLLELLQDEEWWVRKSAVLALSSIAPDDLEVITALQKCLDDPEVQIRIAASIFLRTLHDTQE